jgi:hypothetical protein
MTDHSGAGHVVASTVQPLNTWIHCVASYDGDTQRLYINGLLADSSSGVGIFDWDEAFFSEGIGGHQYDPGNPMDYRFNGKIDDVRIYNRALSADEIQKLYVTEGGLNAGLVAYYPFDGDGRAAIPAGLDAVVFGAVPDLDRFGNPAGALRFVASDLYINYAYYGPIYGYWSGAYAVVPDAECLDPTGDFTVSLWARPDSYGPSMVALSKHLGWVGGEGTWHVEMSPLWVFEANPQWNGYPRTTSLVITGQWMHVCFTYNRASTEWVSYANGIRTDSGFQ